jgi:SulP family sulfate permease
LGLLERTLPGVMTFRGYRREWLLADIPAGVGVCLVMIPSVIAYANLLGIPPQHGLYAALVALLVYPLLGSSRQVIVGPDIAITLLIAAAVAPLAGGDPRRAAALTAAVALLSGLLLLLGARTRMEIVADLLSKPVLVGYMSGAALTLMASQLGLLFGVPLEQRDFLPRLIELVLTLPLTHVPTLILGIGLLALLILLQRFSPRIPGALTILVIVLGASLVLNPQDYGIAVVGSFEGGLPHFAFPGWAIRDIQALLPAALGVALLTYTEGILLARAFAAKNGYEVDAQRELAALGMADVAAGLFQGFSVTGSQARTSLNDASGGKTQLVSIVAAVTLALFLLFLTPLIARVPQVALSAILINAGIGLVEFGAMKRLYRLYSRAGLMAALTMLGVLVAGVVPGILIGIMASLIDMINRVSRPPDAVLQLVPGHGYHDVGDVWLAQTVPGLIAYRFYAPLVFSNIGHFVGRVRDLVAASPTPVRWFLIDAQAITDIDVTALDSLRELDEDFRRRGIALKMARANRPLREILGRSDIIRDLGRESFFPSVHEGVQAFQGVEKGRKS